MTDTNAYREYNCNIKCPKLKARETRTDALYVTNASSLGSLDVDSVITDTLTVNSTSSFSGDLSVGTALSVDKGNGRIGVNKSTPLYNLDVNGNAYITSTCHVGNLFDTGGNTLVADPNTGKVGINTAIPTEALEVTGNTKISGNATISGNSTISGNATISGSTTLSGDTSLGGDLTMSKYSSSFKLYPRIRTNQLVISGDNGYISIPAWTTRITIIANTYQWSTSTQLKLQIGSNIGFPWTSCTGTTSQMGSAVSAVGASGGLWTNTGATASVSTHHMIATLTYIGMFGTYQRWACTGNSCIASTNTSNFNGSWQGASNETLEKIGYSDANLTGGYLFAIFE